MDIGKISNLRNSVIALVSDAGNLKELEELRVSYLGRKGKVNELMQDLPGLSSEEKKKYGVAVNEVKGQIEMVIKERRSELENKPIKSTFFDPTLPGVKPVTGELHPVTKIFHEVEDIFKHFGFSVATGPEIEWDEINFQKLLLGVDHPSRDTQETYYFNKNQLLRVHTSSVQIRYMENHKVPIRIISPGRVYRRDTIDATHLPSFHQIEGLMVDEKTSLTDLLGMLEYTVKRLFGKKRKVRFYGHHFPYTEPSLEVEMQNEKGKWVEILGCGMVSPQVLENCGIDSKKYQGWAFGMGADRLAMLKYGVSDIRSMFSGDLKFLKGKV